LATGAGKQRNRCRPSARLLFLDREASGATGYLEASDGTRAMCSSSASSTANLGA